MKACTLAIVIVLSGCNHMTIYDGYEPVYKYNPHENRTELTHPDSDLRYNVFSREWVYVK